MTNHKSVVVAVDGPSASGKSTVSRLTAGRLGFVYVDSGAFYRGITWKAVRDRVDVKDSEAVQAMIEKFDWELYQEDAAVRFRIDGEDPGEQIRSEPVRENVSSIAAMPLVREFVVEQLRATADLGSIVMEGRDIGSVVFPDTPFKFYLDADPAERARRRHEELVRQEGDSEVKVVLESLSRRDQMDSTRRTAPLQVPLGCTVIDSTGMSIEEVVDRIVETVEQ